MAACYVWRSVRVGSQVMKADMEVEEGWKGGPVVEVRGGQPFSGTIVILFSTSFLLGSVVLGFPNLIFTMACSLMVLPYFLGGLLDGVLPNIPEALTSQRKLTWSLTEVLSS